MEVEYGVKTTNKFLISEFTGDDDDILDPSEILKKLIDHQLADKNAAALKKKNAVQVPPGQQKKKMPGSTAVSDKPFDKSRSLRSANNKENDSSNIQRDGPRRFPRGESNQTPMRGGIARTRQQRPERTDLPPRFRQGGNEDQEFPPQDKVWESNDANEPDVKSGGGIGGGFGAGFGAPAEGEDTRQFGGNRPARGGFGGQRSRFNNEAGGGFRGNRGGGGFGNGGGFGGGFGGSGGRQPRRQFDRQSGSDKTGVKHVDKRDGGGAHNWGSAADAVADQLSSMDASADETAVVQPSADNNEPAVNDETVDEKVAEEVNQNNVEPEPVQLTLDEWKAQQAHRAPPQFNVRRPGEGEKNPVWEKLKPLKRSGETNAKKKRQQREQQVEEEEEEEYEEDNKLVPIDIRFIGEPLRRGGRGGGGMRGRGRGDFGGGRGGRGEFGGNRGGDFGGGRGGFGGGRSEFGGERGDFGAGQGGGFGGRRGGFGEGFGQGRGDRQRDGVKKDEIPYKIDDETFPSLS